jgi:Zn-dependent protease
MDDPNAVFIVGVQFLLLWLSISAHEAAHAWMADRCGDPTARTLGRVTLNPLRHFDLLGSLLFPALLIVLNVPFSIFGWGRSTPVLEKNLRQPGRDDVLVIAAGPAVNLLLAGLATIGIIMAVEGMGEEARRAGTLALVYQTEQATALEGFPVMFTLVRMATINAFLAVFNLIPLPPMDGGQIALHLLPPDWSARLAAVRPYGFMIGLGVALLGLPLLLVPVYGVLALVINLV